MFLKLFLTRSAENLDCCQEVVRQGCFAKIPIRNHLFVWWMMRDNLDAEYIWELSLFELTLLVAQLFSYHTTVPSAQMFVLSVVVLPIWILTKFPIQCAAYVRRKA